MSKVTEKDLEVLKEIKPEYREWVLNQVEKEEVKVTYLYELVNYLEDVLKHTQKLNNYKELSYKELNDLLDGVELTKNPKRLVNNENYQIVGDNDDFYIFFPKTEDGLLNLSHDRQWVPQEEIKNIINYNHYDRKRKNVYYILSKKECNFYIILVDEFGNLEGRNRFDSSYKVEDILKETKFKAFLFEGWKPIAGIHYISTGDSKKDEILIKLLKYRQDPKKATVNDDLTVDYQGNINFRGLDFEEIPFNFGEVTGYFNCGACKNLKTLKGVPKKIGGTMYFNHCDSLEDISMVPDDLKKSMQFYGSLKVRDKVNPVFKYFDNEAKMKIVQKLAKFKMNLQYVIINDDLSVNYFDYDNIKYEDIDNIPDILFKSTKNKKNVELKSIEESGIYGLEDEERSKQDIIWVVRQVKDRHLNEEDLEEEIESEREGVMEDEFFEELQSTKISKMDDELDKLDDSCEALREILNDFKCRSWDKVINYD